MSDIRVGETYCDARGSRARRVLAIRSECGRVAVEYLAGGERRSAYLRSFARWANRRVEERTASGSTRVVQAKGERWHLTFWRDGRAPDDAISVSVERDGHNFDPTLNAQEAGALIDAILELMPAARRYAKLLGDSR